MKIPYWCRRGYFDMPSSSYWCHFTWRFLSSAKPKTSFNFEALCGSVLVLGCNTKSSQILKKCFIRRVEHKLSKGNFKNYLIV